ncbi:MAG: putative porin [Bacteroidota bacterium]
MIQKALFFVLLSLPGVVSAQWSPSIIYLDTIGYTYRTGGDLDTVDRISGRYSSTLPGGGLEIPFGFPSMELFSAYRGMYRFQKIDYVPFAARYSGLPHLGFSYVFGTQATQIARLGYEQVFGKKVLLNFDMTNDRSNGFLRFGSHALNDLGLRMHKKGEVWSFNLCFDDRKHESLLNGGVLSNTDPNEFPLIFLGVNKRNASSLSRITTVRYENYFDFVRDTVSSFGIMSAHSVNVNSRKYNETDTLSGIYPMVNFSDTETNDRFQYSETDHGFGFFLGSAHRYFSIRLHGKYWKYYHAGTDTDTLETALRSDISLKWKVLSINGKGYFNISGAGNEWSSDFILNGRLSRFHYRFAFKSERLWPFQFQRNYLANNFAYSLDEYQQQGRTSMSAEMFTDVKGWKFNGKITVLQLKDNYFFDPQIGSWSNQIHPELFMSSFGLSVHWVGKRLSMQSQYTFTLERGGLDVVPDHVLFLRGQIRGRLFKSKRLEVYTGAELLANSTANRLLFIPAIDTYVMNNSGSLLGGMINAHVFAGLQIDEFRFFVRFENLGTIWNDNGLFAVVGYPIPAGQLRIGLTWDFFN